MSKDDDYHFIELNDHGCGEDRISQLVKKSGEKIGNKPAKTIEYRDKGDSRHSVIIIRTGDATKVLQIAWWRDGTVKHLDCKNCGNNWYLANTDDYSEKFELEDATIKCKECGATGSYSSVE